MPHAAGVCHLEPLYQAAPTHVGTLGLPEVSLKMWVAP